MRHIREEDQFGLRGDPELLVKLCLLVLFLFEQPVAGHKLFLMAAALPIGAEQKKTDSEKKHDNRNAGVEKRRLRRMLRPIIIDLCLEQFHFPCLFFQGLVLKEKNIGIR